MAAEINASVYVNSEDAFVAWAPSDFIPNCWGFQRERKRKVGNATPIDIVENRAGFEKDAPKSGDHIELVESAEQLVTRGAGFVVLRCRAFLGRGGDTACRAGIAERSRLQNHSGRLLRQLVMGMWPLSN